MENARYIFLGAFTGRRMFSCAIFSLTICNNVWIILAPLFVPLLSSRIRIVPPNTIVRSPILYIFFTPAALICYELISIKLVISLVVGCALNDIIGPQIAIVLFDFIGIISAPLRIYGASALLASIAQPILTSSSSRETPHLKRPFTLRAPPGAIYSSRQMIASNARNLRLMRRRECFFYW